MAAIHGEPVQLQPLKRVPSLVDLHNLLTWLIGCQESYMLEYAHDTLKQVLLPWSHRNSSQLYALGISLAKGRPDALPVWIFYKNLEPEPQVEWSHATKDISLIHNLILCSFPEEKVLPQTETGNLEIVAPKESPVLPSKSSTGHSNPLAPVLAGSLQKLRIDGLLQSLASSCITGKLLLSQDEKTGVVFFDEGLPVHCESNGEEGHHAMLELLAWSEGTFEVVADVRAPKKSITRRMESLLMESAVLVDYTCYLDSLGINAATVLEKISMSQADFINRMKTGNPVDMELLRATAKLVDGSNSIESIGLKLGVPKAQWLPVIFCFVKVGVVQVSAQPDKSAESHELAVHTRNFASQGLVDVKSYLYSYATFQFLLDLEWTRYQVHQRTFSVILLLADESEPGAVPTKHFVAIAKRLRVILRPPDLLCHYKRHHIGIILPETHEANAELFAKMISEEIAAYADAIANAALMSKITVCAASASKDCKSKKDLLSMALAVST